MLKAFIMFLSCPIQQSNICLTVNLFFSLSLDASFSLFLVYSTNIVCLSLDSLRMVSFGFCVIDQMWVYIAQNLLYIL